MKEVFAIFGKRPIPRFAKTRLEKSLGEEKTQALYSAFIEEFFRRFDLYQDKEIHLFATPNEEATRAYFKGVIKKPFSFYFQSELPFFARLKEVFEKIEDSFIHLTGTDIPDFPFEIISEAKPDLKRVYIGPDQGGGFYYLGAHSTHAKIFAIDLESGSDNVLLKIMERAKSLNLEVILLKKWSDIDQIEDLNAYVARNTMEKISPTLKDLLP